MLLSLAITMTQPTFVATQVQAFGLYCGDYSYPASDSTFRTGTLVIVRRTQADGTVITDLQTLPVLGRTMILRIASKGQIIRDKRGRVRHIEASAKWVDPKVGNYGSSTWDLPADDSKFLTGWSESAWNDRHPTRLENDAAYALGSLEALTYDPGLQTWRVPSPSDTHRVSLGIPSPEGPYLEYSFGEGGTQGRYWFQGREAALRIRPIQVKGIPRSTTKLNGRPVTINHAAIALFDSSNKLVGLGYTYTGWNDMDSQTLGGASGPILAQPPEQTAPKAFKDLSINTFAAAIDLSPRERSAILASL